MRPIAAEKGIVKVVHPGGYVEILKEPVTAGEVMRKNPRHCLTRPDVFKFPWIVIKPESALPPGKVFLLVPNRTLYDLTKSEKHRHHHQQQQNLLPRRENRINNYATSVRKKTTSSSPSSSLSSPPKAFAGMTPKHRARQNPSPIHDVPRNKDDGKPRSSSEKELCGEGQAGTPYWLDRRNTYEEFRRYLASEAESSDVNSEAIDGDILRASTARCRQDRRRDNGGNFEEMVLRSCLKKPESDRKSLGLRVSFAVPLTGRDKETESSTNINTRRSKY